MPPNFICYEVAFFFLFLEKTLLFLSISMCLPLFLMFHLTIKLKKFAQVLKRFFLSGLLNFLLLQLLYNYSLLSSKCFEIVSMWN